MATTRFDATITLNDHRLGMAGMSDRRDEAVAAVRQAVERMDGAGWIDVEALDYPAHIPGWVILYPVGSASRLKRLIGENFSMPWRLWLRRRSWRPARRFNRNKPVNRMPILGLSAEQKSINTLPAFWSAFPPPPHWLASDLP